MFKDIRTNSEFKRFRGKSKFLIRNDYEKYMCKNYGSLKNLTNFLI